MIEAANVTMLVPFTVTTVNVFASMTVAALTVSVPMIAEALDSFSCNCCSGHLFICDSLQLKKRMGFLAKISYLIHFLEDSVN